MGNFGGCIEWSPICWPLIRCISSLLADFVYYALFLLVIATISLCSLLPPPPSLQQTDSGLQLLVGSSSVPSSLASLPPSPLLAFTPHGEIMCVITCMRQFLLACAGFLEGGGLMISNMQGSPLPLGHLAHTVQHTVHHGAACSRRPKHSGFFDALTCGRTIVQFPYKQKPLNGVSAKQQTSKFCKGYLKFSHGH